MQLSFGIKFSYFTLNVDIFVLSPQWEFISAISMILKLKNLYFVFSISSSFFAFAVRLMRDLHFSLLFCLFWFPLSRFCEVTRFTSSKICQREKKKDCFCLIFESLWVFISSLPEFPSSRLVGSPSNFSQKLPNLPISDIPFCSLFSSKFALDSFSHFPANVPSHSTFVAHCAFISYHFCSHIFFVALLLHFSFSIQQ